LDEGASGGTEGGGGVGGVLHGVDLPVGTRKAFRTCRQTEFEVRGGDHGVSDPGALVAGGNTGGWHGDGSGSSTRSQLNCKSGFVTALGLALWATDLGELHSFIDTLWDELLGVEDDCTISCDVLVESVGAPPA